MKKFFRSKQTTIQLIKIPHKKAIEDEDIYDDIRYEQYEISNTIDNYKIPNYQKSLKLAPARSTSKCTDYQVFLNRTQKSENVKKSNLKSEIDRLSRCYNFLTPSQIKIRARKRLGLRQQLLPSTGLTSARV